MKEDKEEVKYIELKVTINFKAQSSVHVPPPPMVQEILFRPYYYDKKGNKIPYKDFINDQLNKDKFIVIGEYNLLVDEIRSIKYEPINKFL